MRNGGNGDITLLLNAELLKKNISVLLQMLIGTEVVLLYKTLWINYK